MSLHHETERSLVLTMNKHARVEAAIVRFIAAYDPFVRRALSLTELAAALRGVVS